jgi:Ca2+-binding RTX toxin-like protein
VSAMRRRLPAVLAPPLALAALAAPAHAGTVSVMTRDSCNGDLACSKYAQGFPVPYTAFAGGPGEANRLVVTRVGADFLLRDTGAALRAEAPCTSVDAGTARCPVTEGRFGIPGLSLAMGDGDDTALLGGGLEVVSWLSGGDGDDALTGGDGPEQVDGGPGSDTLQGGGGVDILTYADRSAPVLVDLATGTGGGVGERDDLGGFETVVGGKAADHLRGGPADDVLDGAQGADRVDGGGGDDEVFGGTGTDRLSGGAGADRLFGDPAQGDDYYTPTFPWGHDRLYGGPGDDQLYDTGGRNTFSGGAGDDLLEGGVGSDRLRGGAGADAIDARDGARDDLRCGTGLDRTRTDRRDRLRGCERRWRTGT